MKLLSALLLTALTLPAYSQVCPPCEQDLLGYECSGGGQPHMVLGDNDGLTEARHAATFTPVHAGSTTIGNVTISFVIGSSNASTKFITDNGGECVGTSGVQYPGGFPPIAAVAGRALQLSGRNPLYCHEPTRDLICFSVKGQVGAPFPALQCVPDRVELACGVVVS